MYFNREIEIIEKEVNVNEESVDKDASYNNEEIVYWPTIAYNRK